jgi:alanyl-tRNA synthetase
VVPSASLVSEDPTLLFTVAGMVPFVPYLTGQQTAPYKRATSVQKCVRTSDIDEVGKTTRHGTFFQMNGNFSFGDYFKREAIAFAWELLTTAEADGGLGFDPERLWATVYLDDDEAHGMWREIGMPAERIQRRDMADNYWHTGQPGPGGPCSEIYYDRGPAYGVEGGPEADEDRYIEIWNLVFMQYRLSAVRSKTDFDIEGELPAKNIDTGMGLERVAFLKQGVDNMYEIDEVRPVLDAAAALSGRRYGADRDDDVRMRVVADHVRSALMLMGDGVTPSNEGAGYVLRRLVRRAVRSMRLLGVEAPSLPQLLPVSRDAMKASYPELATDFARISQVAYGEEESFRRTLSAGTTILDTAVARAKTGATTGGGAAGAPSISGEQAFTLHDTNGFPIDLTLEMAAEQGVAVDADRFRALMLEQRTRAREDARAKKSGQADTTAYRTIADALGAGGVVFTGYEDTSGEGTVVGLLRDGAAVPVALSGDDVELVLDRTPFYAESGGQLADHGRITVVGPQGTRAVVEVDDVQKPIPGLSVHRGRVLSGEVAVGDGVESAIDVARRTAIARAHTATHLVHAGIRDALGDTARQAGSENAPGRFRFDFTATSALPGGVLADVEAQVNGYLVEDLDVVTRVMSIDEARATGAMALFGEKYGDRVRVVSIGEWSKELCGGTHVARSGQLGVVSLLGEASIGSGVRRVEALVGADAHGHLARESALVSQLTGLLKVRAEELPDRVSSLLAQLKEADRAVASVRTAQVLAGAAGLAQGARDVAGVALVTADAGEVGSADDLRTLALDVRGRLGEGPATVVVAGVAKDRPVVVIATTAAARELGVKAGALVRVAAQALGGGGGGKDDLAQGGGTDAGAVPAALEAVERAVLDAARG